MKKGKELEIKLHKDFNTFYGTVDNKNLKTIYIKILAWAEPVEDFDSYGGIISKPDGSVILISNATAEDIIANARREGRKLTSRELELVKQKGGLDRKPIPPRRKGFSRNPNSKTGSAFKPSKPTQFKKKESTIKQSIVSRTKIV